MPAFHIGLVAAVAVAAALWMGVDLAGPWTTFTPGVEVKYCAEGLVNARSASLDVAARTFAIGSV